MTYKSVIISKLHALILVVFLLFSASSLFAAPIVDGPVAREKLQRDVQDLLYQQKFGELEILAKQLRVSKARFPEGHWKLMYVYSALETPPQGPRYSPFPAPSWKWERHFALLDKWRMAYPTSITAKVATANAWLNYGWEARGRGRASTVTPEGWEQLAKRMEVAEKLVKATPTKAEDDCPERFNLLLTLAKVQGMPRGEFLELLQKAVAFEPQYAPFYAAAVDYFTTRWSGEPDEWVSYVEKADAMAGQPDQREFYARVAIGLWDDQWKSFEDSRISWKKVKKGYQDMARKYPGSQYNLNNFAQFACVAGDIEVARELLKQIGDSPYLSIWRIPPTFEACRKAAGVTGMSENDILRHQKDQENVQKRVLAEQGDKLSRYLLAESYLYYADFGRDRNAGLRILRELVEQDYPPAMGILGKEMWETGKTDAEKMEGLDLMERAALRFDDIRFRLPQFYEQGPKPNLIKAYAWYSLITKGTSGKEAISRLSMILTPEQLEVARKEAERIRKIVEEVP